MKKKHEEHVNLERWLVSYADFITLLFAFFVIMYALAQSDKAKFSAAAESIRRAFNAHLELGGISGGETLNSFEMKKESAFSPSLLDDSYTNAPADPELKRLGDLLEESMNIGMNASEDSGSIQMSYEHQGLVIHVITKDFFDLKKKEARLEVRPLLKKIGEVFSQSLYPIRIEGHTDLKESEDGWGLSCGRAAWVANYWIRKLKFDQKKIGIAGYADYRPLTEKRGPLEESKNRRIEIVVSNY